MRHILQQSSRRLFPLYNYYRAQLRAADAMGVDARVAYRDSRLARVKDWAQSTGLDFDRLTSKEDVRENPDRYRRWTLWPIKVASTGGTTGTPLIVYRPFNTVVYEQATIDHIVALAGVDLARARVAVFRGDNIKAPDDLSPPYWRDEGGSFRIFSSVHLSGATASSVLRALIEFRPDVLYCYPSTLQLLISYIREQQIEVRVGLVLTSSEYLPPELFQLVRDVFGCVLVDYYGQAERVCFAWADAASAYRFRPDYGVVELSRPDRLGVIVGTNLHNRAQILPHYDTGDAIVGTPHTSEQQLSSIALGLSTFEGIAGRTAETMLLPDGRQIVGFNQMPRFVTGADYVQFLRTGPLSLDVHVVRGRNFSEDTLLSIERNVRLKVPPEVTTRYVFGDAPLRSPRGKSPIYLDEAAR